MTETQTVSQLTDEQILYSIESVGSSGTDQLLTFAFSLNKTFFIMVKAGMDGTSEPADILEHLTDYKEMTIELYHHRDPPPPEMLQMDPIEFEAEKDGQKIVYKFEFDVQCFPHLMIDPKSEEPFKNQPWAEGFRRGRFVNAPGRFDVHTLCEIIRYCDKISRLKMFW